MSYLFRVPSHSTDRFPAIIVQGQALFFCFNVPHSHKAPTTTRYDDMRHLFVPIQAFEVICSCGSATEAEWIFDVVKVGYKKLFVKLGDAGNSFTHCRTSPFAPAVANNSDLNGLNSSALMAPLCIDVRVMKASLNNVSEETVDHAPN